jgi:acid phosphatase type 7
VALSSASRPVSNVHLALSSDVTKMHVQWTSAPGDILGNNTATVQWGVSPRSLQNQVFGYQFNFTDVQKNISRTYYLNAATMTGLTPGAQYFYRVGDDLDGWSSVFNFVATRSADMITPENPLRIAFFGDLGWYYAQSLSYIQTEAAQGVYDHVTHVGDYAYDLQDQNGNVGDQFQDSIEPITSSTPYMGCEG